MQQESMLEAGIKFQFFLIKNVFYNCGQFLVILLLVIALIIPICRWNMISQLFTSITSSKNSIIVQK